jgi:hypothetical protein
VRISDAYAESLRVPPGGRPRVDRRAIATHLGGVVLTVCLVALLALGMLDLVTTAVVPRLLTPALLSMAAGGAAVTILARRD